MNDHVRADFLHSCHWRDWKDSHWSRGTKSNFEQELNVLFIIAHASIVRLTDRYAGNLLEHLTCSLLLCGLGCCRVRCLQCLKIPQFWLAASVKNNVWGDVMCSYVWCVNTKTPINTFQPLLLLQLTLVLLRMGEISRMFSSCWKLSFATLWSTKILLLSCKSW